MMDYGNGFATGRLINWGKKDKPRVARTKHQEQTQTATIYLDLYRQSGLPISMELTTVREFMAGLSLERLQQFKASLDANLSKSFGILPAFIAEPDLEWE